jgi:hypothetical protein
MKNIVIAVAAGVVLFVLLFAQRNSLLHKGANQGKTAMMSVAMVVGADANGYDESGATPLMNAAESGQVEAVQKLIAKKVDINRKHRDTGTTALMLAAGRGHGEVVDALLAAGAAVDVRDNDERTAYTHAFQNNKFDVSRKVRYVAANNVELPTTPTSGAAGVKTAPRAGKQIRKLPASAWEPKSR